MKKYILSVTFWVLVQLSFCFSSGILFSFTINNNDPTFSVVSVFAQYNNVNYNNAIGYTLAFYYDAAEATTASGDWDFSPSTNLGWHTAGNTNYSNQANSNPDVPITFTNRIEVQCFDDLFNGTDFTTSPTLICKFTFNKSIGTAQYGGEIYIGATEDTDDGIAYADDLFAFPPIVVTGAREGLLPLELVSFEAKKYNERNSILNWTTSSETNSSHFLVQRSLDKKLWESIGKVGAAGNSQMIENYEFLDENVFNGYDARLSVYYRLLMVDIDGQTKVSPVESVVFGNSNVSKQEFIVYPNPSTDGLQVEWDANRVDQPTALEFFDIEGKLVYSQKVSENTNQSYVDFGKTTIQPGLYLLRILNGIEPLDYKQIVVGNR